MPAGATPLTTEGMTSEETESPHENGRTRVVRERYESRVGHLARIRELRMRSRAVRETLTSRAPAEALYWVDQLIRGAVWGRQADMDAILGLVLWLVEQPRGGESYEFLEQLYRIAYEHEVDSVIYLLQNPPPHQQLSAEASLPEVRLPIEREEITVGERRTIARKCNRDIIKRLTLDPSPLVIENLLDNPDTTESDLLKTASRRPTQPEILEKLAVHEMWFGRSKIRKALVMNPYNDTGISLKLLPTLGITALRQVRFGSDLHQVLGESAEYLVDMRETYTSPWEV